VVSEIEAAGGRAEAIAAHAGDPESARAAVQEAVRRCGRLDILVNNAATNPYFGPALGISVPQLDKTWEVNLRGPLLFVQAAHAAWMGEHGGVVCNIASIGGLGPEPNIGAYNAMKAALIHMTGQLAGELGPTVRVVGVAPGLVKTDMARALWEAHEESLARAFPAGRLGEPEDIARAVTFLVSDEASWITGSMLVVDGGASVRLG